MSLPTTAPKLGPWSYSYETNRMGGAGKLFT
jgi:hypothetical protein